MTATEAIITKYESKQISFVYTHTLNFRNNRNFIFFSSIFSVVERELNVPLPLSKIIKKWNNLLQEYKVSIFIVLIF